MDENQSKSHSTLPSKDDYRNIVDDTIDELNTSANYSGTRLTKLKRKIKIKRSSTHKTLMYALCILVVANFVLYSYYHSTTPQSVSLDTANSQLKTLLADQMQQHEPLYELLTLSETFQSPVDPNFRSTVDNLNKALVSSGSTPNETPHADDFEAFAGGIFYHQNTDKTL